MLTAPPRPTRRTVVLARALAVVALALLSIVGAATASSAAVIVNFSHSGPSTAGQLESLTVALDGPDCAGTVVTFEVSGSSDSSTAGADCIASGQVRLPSPSSCPSRGGIVTAVATIPGAAQPLPISVKCAAVTPTKSPTPKPSKTPTPTPTATPTPTPTLSQPVASSPPPASSPAGTPSVSTPPELSASPTISQSLAAVVLAPLVPLDDGGPQPPTGTGGAGLGDDLAALGVLVVGGLATYWLWRRGHNRAVVGGGIALTMLLAAVVIAVPVALAEDPPPSSSVRLRPTSVDVKVPPAKSGTATAQCPAGSVLVGGGARTTLTAADSKTVPVSDEAALLLSASKPTANGWEATATAPSDAGVQLTLTSLALCTTDNGVDSLLVTAAPLQVAADSAERAQARCPEGHPLALGWAADHAQSVAALPLAESASITSWAGSEPTSATASALCTTATSTVHVVRYDGSAVLIDPDGHGVAEAACPTGQESVGGGFVAAASVGGRISRVAVQEATPSAERYSVKAASVKSGGGVLLTAYALCVPTS